MGIFASTRLSFSWHVATLPLMIYIINHCRTWYGSNHGGLKAMFVYLKYLQMHNVFSKYEVYDANTIDGVGFVDIDGLLNINGNGLFSFDGGHNDEFENSSTQIRKCFRFYGTCIEHQCNKVYSMHLSMD
jgi:hypothetical protein